MWIGENLFIGKIYVGSIMRLVPDGWREYPTYMGKDKERPDYVKRNIENTVKYYEKNEAKPWRAWLMLSEDGSGVGTYATKNEAMSALETAAKDAIGEE